MSDQRDDEQTGGAAEESPLDRAARMGPLPGVEAEEAAEERGEDESWVPDDRPGLFFGGGRGPGAPHGD